MPHVIHILVFPAFQLLDATGPAQVFATANDELARLGRPAAYVIRLISTRGGPVTSSAGLDLGTQALPAAAELTGATLVVAGGRGVFDALEQPDLPPWLTQAADRAERCCSVCTGAFLLAATGRLNGRLVATHWAAAERLAQCFPAIRLQDDSIHVHDGKFHSSAGVTAGIDLSLALVEADLGRPLAVAVAKRLVVHMKRPGGQRQFSSELLSQTADDPLRRRLTDWLRPRLQHSLAVEDMAQAVGLAARSLHRHLHRSGTTPARLLLEMRLELACRLLEQEQASLKAIARQTGFASLYNLHRAFVRRFGVGPSDYRARFG